MPKSQKTAKRKRVLLIEDNENDIELVRWRLAKELDCEVIYAMSAADFEAALKQQAPDVIVSDSGLLEMDGMAALKIAKVIRPETPFVFCSGESPSPKVTQALEAGATSWIKKDPRYADLITELRKVLGI